MNKIATRFAAVSALGLSAMGAAHAAVLAVVTTALELQRYRVTP